jgi:hypothetical protein
MACQIPLKLGLPSGVRGARYAAGALGFGAAAAGVAGAVCANDGEALKHNAHTVSVIAILKVPLRYRLGWLASAEFVPLFQHVRER